MPRTLCTRCGGPAMAGWSLCASCATKAAHETLGGAKNTNPLITERVAAAAWPRHERSAA